MIQFKITRVNTMQTRNSKHTLNGFFLVPASCDDKEREGLILTSPAICFDIVSSIYSRHLDSANARRSKKKFKSIYSK